MGIKRANGAKNSIKIKANFCLQNTSGGDESGACRCNIDGMGLI